MQSARPSQIVPRHVDLVRHRNLVRHGISCKQEYLIFLMSDVHRGSSFSPGIDTSFAGIMESAAPMEGEERGRAVLLSGWEAL